MDIETPGWTAVATATIGYWIRSYFLSLHARLKETREEIKILSKDVSNLAAKQIQQEADYRHIVSELHEIKNRFRNQP